MMSAVPKKKLCWHCEGSVALADAHCPYCGVYLDPEANPKETKVVPANELGLFKKEEHQPYNPFPSNNTIDLSLLSRDLIGPLFALSFLMCGTTIGLLALFLFAFSEVEAITFRLYTAYWPLFLLIALPMLFGGWKFLTRMNEE